MAANTTAPTSTVVAGAYTQKWLDKNAITDNVVSRTLHRNYSIDGYRFVDVLNASEKTNISAKGMEVLLQESPLRTFKTGSVITAGSAGGNITVTAHADNYDANSQMVLRKGFDVIIPEAFMTTGIIGDRAYNVVDITGTTVTLSPWNKTGTNAQASQIGANIASGTELMIGASAFAPGTGQPEGTTDSFSKRGYLPRIMKETIAIEGGQVAQPYFPATGFEGSQGLVTEGIIRAQFLLENQVERYLCDGEINDSDALTGTSGLGGVNNMKSGYGLLPLARLYSPKHYYATKFELEDFYDIKLLQENRGCHALVSDFFVGPSLGTDLEHLGLETTKTYSNTDLYDKLKEKIGIEFKVWHFGGRTFVIHVFGSWANPAQAGLNIGGAYSYKHPSTGLVVPRERVTAQEWQGESNKSIPNLQLGYVNYNGENRTLIQKVLPGMSGLHGGDTVSSGTDGTYYYWLTHCALIAGGEGKWVLVQKQR